jgi:Flp pilus assembly protein TadG
MNDTALTKRGRTRADRGQQLVEFAMIVPLFFFLIFAVLDLGHIFYIEMTLQNAIRQAGRYAVTGNSGYNGAANRLQSIQQVAQQESIGLINAGSVEVGVVTNPVSGGPAEIIWGTAGGPSDTVIVELSTTVPFFTPMIGAFFPNGGDTITVSTTFKNEPF